MRKTLAIAAALAVAAIGSAQAQNGPNLIEMRQVGFSLMAGDFAGIRAVSALKGDVKTLENPAKAMQRYAALIPSLFPQGTAAGNNTKALPAIWSDNDGFVKAAAGLGEATGKLAELAKAGDADGVAAQIKVVGDACGACHRPYRAR
ncbi:MAG: cytochrome c [Acetobacteraceae bacterium]